MFSKTRWLVLRKFTLDVLKSEREGKVIMTIQLKDVTGVSRSEDIKLAIEVTLVKNSNANIASTPLSNNRDLPQKSVYFVMANDDEIYDWIDAISTRCPGMGGVSNPTNFSHRVHVGFDPRNGQFVGLPTEWERLLNASAITREDYQRNPTAVVEVLQFYSDITNRQQNPDVFHSLMPTPPVSTNQNMQLGHGGGGTAIAPPRPPPPTSHGSSQRVQQNGSPTSRNGTPVSSQRNVSNPDQDRKMGMDAEMRRAMEDEARKIKAAKEQRDAVKAEEEQNRRDQETYNAGIPKKTTPMAKQEIGGYGGGAPESTSSRYNPTRTAPPAPGVERNRQQPQGSLRAPTSQRAPNVQAPAGSNDAADAVPKKTTDAYGSAAPQKPSTRTQEPITHSQQPLRIPVKTDQPRQPSPSSRTPAGPADRTDRKQTNQTHVRANGAQPHGTARPQQQPNRVPPGAAQPAPLNVKQPTGAPPAEASDPHKQAEMALTAKVPATTRQKEVRMSSMTESQVMEKLKQVVSKDDPHLSYNKQKKIGQGASGSVYVAKIQENATSAVAKRIFKTYGSKAQVAIKQMDLRNQPRKELIVNEIMVMKESSHPNIVNFLDSFLQEGNNELWVVMEFMEGGALTDVIDNNSHITEAQISTICNEVSACLYFTRKPAN